MKSETCETIVGGVVGSYLVNSTFALRLGILFAHVGGGFFYMIASAVKVCSGNTHTVGVFTLMRKAEHTSFLASKFLAYCRAERFARPIHGVANLRRRSACGVTRGHDYRLAFLGVHETRCFQQPWLIAGRNGEEPVFIGMDQLPGHNAPSKNLYLSTL